MSGPRRDAPNQGFRLSSFQPGSIRVFACRHSSQNRNDETGALGGSLANLLTYEVIVMAQTPSTMLPLGTPAPDFSLPSQLDRTITLSDLRGKNVILAFYPLAWTPV